MSIYQSIQNRWNTIALIYPWHFIGFLVLAMLIPKFYDLTNVFWIGQISYDALAITEQYEFIAITIEIINETIPFAILALIAQNYRNQEKVISILKAGLILHVTLTLIVTAVVLLFTSEFVSMIGTPTEIVQMTTQYLVLKSVALPFEAVAILLLIAIKSMQRGKEALYLVLVSVILNMILDLILISNTSFSLHLGIQGVAIGYVTSKVTLMVISLLYTLHLLDLNWKTIVSATWREHVAPLFNIGRWTGLDSLVRNSGYMGLLLVLNVLGINEFGGYGLAMWVMWTLLIPVLALGEGTSVIVGNYYGEKNYREIKNVVITSMLLVLIIMIAIALLGAFYWTNISAFFNQNPAMVEYSTETFKWLIIPYIGFGIGTILRSVFYGTGKTRYIFYIACFINIGMIIPYVSLVQLGVIPANFTSVMMFYMVSFLADPVLAYIGVRKVMQEMQPENERNLTQVTTSP